MSKKRKSKEITEQEWQEIIEYAKANTITNINEDKILFIIIALNNI